MSSNSNPDMSPPPVDSWIQFWNASLDSSKLLYVQARSNAAREEVLGQLRKEIITSPTWNDPGNPLFQKPGLLEVRSTMSCAFGSSIDVIGSYFEPISCSSCLIMRSRMKRLLWRI